LLTTSRPQRPVIPTVVVVAALLAGCGGEEAPQGGRPAVATLGVTESEYAIEPRDGHVPKGGVVEFRVANEGKIEHSLEIEGPEGEFEAESIAPGGSAVLKADLEPGRYKWYCPIGDHESRGMVGSVTVGSGGGGALQGGETPRPRSEKKARPAPKPEPESEPQPDSGSEPENGRGAGGSGPSY
jgi:plastocyanin